MHWTPKTTEADLLRLLSEAGLLEAAGLATKPADLGATWVWDPAQSRVVGTTVTPALDAGGGSVILASADSAHAFSVDTTGPYGAARASLRTNNTLGRLYSATGGPTGAGQFHIIWMGRVFGVGTNGDYESFLQIGAPSAVQNLGLSMTASGLITLIDDAGSPITGVYLDDGASQLAVSNDQDHIIELQYDGTTLSFWINGRRNTTIDVGSGGSPLTLNISDASFGIQSWQTASSRYPIHDSRVDSLMFKTGAPLTRAAINKWLRYELACLGGTGKIVQFFGDSTTAGGAAGTTAASYLPIAVRGKSTGANVIYPQNCGVTSETAAQMLSNRVAINADPLTHAHVWIGVNDVAGSVAAATTYASIVAAVRRLQARGAKVVVGTIHKWGGLSGGQETIRQALNALIMANSAGANAIADYAAALSPFDPADFCAVNDPHPTNAANNNKLAPVGYAALNAV